MASLTHRILSAILLASAAIAPAAAADLTEPPVYEAPPVVIPETVETGGWYIRGDIDYAAMQLRGVDYHTTGSLTAFTTARSSGLYSIGGGIGYQISKHLRADLTGDYEFGGRFTGSTTGDCTNGATPLPGSCTSVDTATYTVFDLMANAYADLGNYHGFTPYIGAGIGGAYVNWGTLTNTATCTSADPVNSPCNTTLPGYTGTTAGGTYTETHQGEAGFRFAWALMAGASYDLSKNLKLDVGYRFKRIEGGKMFKYTTAANGTQGYDRGFNMHTVKVGLRYKLGGTSYHQPEPYVPEPIYKQ